MILMFLLSLVGSTLAESDVGVDAIISDVEFYADSAYIPRARIRNYGNQTSGNFPVIAEIFEQGLLIYADTLAITLEADSSLIVTFAPFRTSSAGSFTLTVRTELEADEHEENDLLSVTIKCGFCLGPDEFPPSGIELENRVIRGVLLVSCILPAGQPGILSLFDISGRRLKSMKVWGISRVELSSALPSGTYLVRLEAGNSSHVKKVAVLR